MKANVINIGNSKGIIIPSKFLKLIGLDKEARIDVEDNKIIIEPIDANPREGWTKMFIKAGSKQDNEIGIPDVFDDENFEDWTW